MAFTQHCRKVMTAQQRGSDDLLPVMTRPDRPPHLFPAALAEWIILLTTVAATADRFTVAQQVNHCFPAGIVSRYRRHEVQAASRCRS
jgi:hypothetical protein